MEKVITVVDKQLTKLKSLFCKLQIFVCTKNELKMYFHDKSFSHSIYIFTQKFKCIYLWRKNLAWIFKAISRCKLNEEVNTHVRLLFHWQIRVKMHQNVKTILTAHFIVHGIMHINKRENVQCFKDIYDFCDKWCSCCWLPLVFLVPKH